MTRAWPAADLEGVTQREQQVLAMVARGLANHEIASHMHLSLATVMTHVSHLLRKLSCRDRAQLVVTAYESGLVSPTPSDRLVHQYHHRE